jgi:hypothetical protein
VPERVYTNRRPGEQRVHIEVTAEEIGELLQDLVLRPGAGDAALKLITILDEASGIFGGSFSAPTVGEDAARLHDHLARVLLGVPLRLGPNAIAQAQRGEAIRMSGGEADQAADRVLTVVRPMLCGASATADSGPAHGPCVLRPDHGGPLHTGPDGEQWLVHSQPDGSRK